MKRIKGLFDPIADYKNLASAAYLATRNCRRNREIVQFFDNLENELNAINQDLPSERYRFGPYQSSRVSGSIGGSKYGFLVLSAAVLVLETLESIEFNFYF